MASHQSTVRNGIAAVLVGPAVIAHHTICYFTLSFSTTMQFLTKAQKPIMNIPREVKQHPPCTTSTVVTVIISAAGRPAIAFPS